jgi:hypothetical protein
MRAYKATSLLLCLACLGASSDPAAPGPGPAATQRITVQLQGAPAESSFFLDPVGVDPIQLADNAAALLEGSFEIPAARSVQLRLLEGGPTGTLLWDGLALLSDQQHATIAFSYVIEGEQHRAARVASCPAPTPAAGSEPSGPFMWALGWGGLVLGYLAVLVLGWALRRRNQGQP